MSGILTGILESIGEGWLQDKATEFAQERFQPTKDPYYEVLPNGERVRRKLPDFCSKQERKSYKKLQDDAWSHDMGMCGSCCWTEWLGWAPILAVLPLIGPACMYSIHSKMLDRAKVEFNLPTDFVLKMHGNIGVDLVIALVPVMGILFSWMNACSTRNCAMIYNFVCQRALETQNQNQNMRRVPYRVNIPDPTAKFKRTEGVETTHDLKTTTYSDSRRTLHRAPPFGGTKRLELSYSIPPVAPPAAAPPPYTVHVASPYTMHKVDQSYPMQSLNKLPYQRTPPPPPPSFQSRAY